MPITELVINQFRNLAAVSVIPSPRTNIFYGQNGSGKTSLLEAIYFLGTGRSFRTSLLPRIIQHQSDRFWLFAHLQHTHQNISIGTERSRQGDKKMRLNGESVTSLALLARQLPLQLLTTDSHRFFHEGPKLRRQFLDWGLFHVEQSFHSHWQQLQKVLKQRNAALKQQLSVQEIALWDHEMVQLAELFDQYRSEYLLQLQPILNNLLAKLLPEFKLDLRYQRGWSQGKSLGEILTQSLTRDRQLGYTQFGPHRADCQLYVEKTPAGDVLSQGQQKLAAYALHLAQGILYQQRIAYSPIYLIDDLPSELDSDKRRLMAAILLDLQAQVFISSIAIAECADMISVETAKMFHVEQGTITSP